MLWHASCLVRERPHCAGVFHLMFDLRQMHVPDAYFGNAHSVLNVIGEVHYVVLNIFCRDYVLIQVFVLNCVSSGLHRTVA